MVCWLSKRYEKSGEVKTDNIYDKNDDVMMIMITIIMTIMAIVKRLLLSFLVLLLFLVLSFLYFDLSFFQSSC